MARNKKKKTPAINLKMPIADIISRYPETMGVFLKYGFHCFGCLGAGFENLRAAAKAHGVKPADLLKDLNRAVEDKKVENKK